MIAPLAHVGGGVFEPLQLLPPLAALAAYWKRARTLDRQGRPLPAWRMACFGGGIALLVAALVTPLAHIAEELVLAHMAQHVLMADLAALLMVLGLTGPMLQPLLATRVARRLRVLAHPVVAFGLWAIDLYVWHIPALYQAALASAPVHALQHGSFVLFGFTMWLALLGPLLQPILATGVAQRLRVLAHPVVAFSLWAVDLYVWHLPFAYQAAVAHGPVHALEHASFVFFGFTMWLALLGPLPQPEWFGNGAKLGYIVAVRLTGGLLGNVFLWSGSVFYPDYRPGQASWDLTPLQDQGAAGTIMMIESSVVTVVLLGWLFVKTARESEERQELLELASARGLELSERRAARAVASGRGEELRRRLEAVR